MSSKPSLFYRGFYIQRNLPWAILLIMIILACSCKNSSSIKDTEIQNKLKQVANEVNKGCPRIIDSETRLDNAGAFSNRTLLYNFTLVNKERSQIDTLMLKSSMEPSIINQFKTSPIFELARQNHLTIKYYFKDRNGIYLFTISITPDKYIIE